MFLRELRGQRNRVQEANQALLNQFIGLQGAFSNAPHLRNYLPVRLGTYMKIIRSFIGKD